MRWSWSSAGRARVGVALLAVGSGAVLVGLLALQAAFFVRHAVSILSFPFPLDYGEGPLLAQITQLRSGASLRDLYGPIDAPPFLIVNYPPVYLAVVWLCSLIGNSVLLAGRAVSLVSACAVVGAVWLLARPSGWLGRTLAGLVALAFLALPIVREWAVLLRVDMLGVALGLWGLVVLRNTAERQRTTGWLALAAALLVASVLTKPSLLAAPVAAATWLLLVNWRRALVFGAWAAGFGIAALVALGAGTHFFEHSIVANANTWQADLASGFWRQQVAIHGSLMLGGMLSALLGLRRDAAAGLRTALEAWTMPLVYTLGGVITALGIGKVGAYMNYFLEFDAGLIWLIALFLGSMPRPLSNTRLLQQALLLALVALGLVRYFPSWSEQYVKIAGVIEGSNPPRLIVGRRGVWQDLRRERQIFAVMARTNAALVGEVAAAGGPILTDIPGIAAQAGQISRLQAFEHSQTMALWDQRDLRIDLANGRVPLVVLDYLGNWLQPEVIALIRNRYAQEGSRGGYDLYRPVAPGAEQPAALSFDQVAISRFWLAPGPYAPGEAVPLTLQVQPQQAAQGTPLVRLALLDTQGQPVAQNAMPLVYGALRVEELPAEGVQHMQPLPLPATLPPGSYQIQVQFGEQVGQVLTSIRVQAEAGQLFANGWLEDGSMIAVPSDLATAWQALGGAARFGQPIMPAVPFAAGMQQCFERGCLREQAGGVVQLPVSEWLAAGDIGANGALVHPQIAAEFADFYAANGGEAELGRVVTNAFRSGDRLVQYTAFARLEQPVAGGDTTFGAIGEDILRLPGSQPYRWPDVQP